ncbi:HEPN domain-containing protein [Dyadobacter sp. 676]|uniref:HEPN domain-containing protein n=1 Tax=Dyadobacter sp. 676 TaxID=3088362 RepID=A0AAU8FEN1_9BACT
MREAAIQSIVEKALDCLKKAKQCYSGEMYDVALNRAYYAMFHSIQALLSSIGASLNKSHTGTHNAFHKDFIATGIVSREYGVALKRIFEQRQFGDYDYEEVHEEEAAKGIADAEKFVLAALQYLKENNHLQ